MRTFTTKEGNKILNYSRKGQGRLDGSPNHHKKYEVHGKYWFIFI